MGYTIIHQTVKKSKKSEPAFRLTLIHSKQYYNLFDNSLTGGNTNYIYLLIPIAKRTS